MRIIFKISSLLAVIIGVSSIACQSETSRKAQGLEKKVRNLETFARLYGYARWFHPSDEAQEIDWDKFAVLGVQKVENVKSSKELRDSLYRLFSPIVQGLQIYEASKPEIFNPDILSSPDPDAKPVAWQHSGVYLNEETNIYKSIRTNKSEGDKKDERTSLTKAIFFPSHLIGKEVKLSGYFKCNKGSAKLYIQPIISSRYDKKHETFIEESQDWIRYELMLTIPQKTIGISYGFSVDGDVEAWADDFEFAVNTDDRWILADTANMGFERGKMEDEAKPIVEWTAFSMTSHIFEVTDENPFSGKFSLKVYNTEKILDFVPQLFDFMPQIGEITKEPIGNNLVCVVPVTLLTNDTSTYPQTENTILMRLQSELTNVNADRYGFNPQVNLASVIIVWNVLQHFFPYFDVIDANWNAALSETLKSTFNNKRKKDFFVTLSLMIAKIEDGHGVVSDEQMYHLPIKTELIENEIIITSSNDPDLKGGDIIKKIDGKSVMEALEEKEKIISGSSQFRRHWALNVLGSKFDPGKTNLLIERDGMQELVTVSNTIRGSMYFNPKSVYLSETIIEIDPCIYYINMANCTEKEFEQSIDALANAKAVIYDQRRGNRLNFFKIVPYWIEEPVYSTWWNVPQTVYPDRKDVEFDKTNWSLQPKQPLFKSKSVIINESSVLSAGETMMGIIDHYHLATTVGETTAGCNGNVNNINLPCGYNFMFTGMRVLKHDGSQLYLKGFEPDYPVSKTIQAIKEGRDEYLEKALEVAKDNQSIVTGFIAPGLCRRLYRLVPDKLMIPQC